MKNSFRSVSGLIVAVSLFLAPAGVFAGPPLPPLPPVPPPPPLILPPAPPPPIVVVPGGTEVRYEHGKKPRKHHHDHGHHHGKKHRHDD